MSRSDFVVLRGGLSLPLAAVRLALDLEARGLHMRREDGDVLIVGPRELLTAEDRAGLRQWKPQLLAIVTYDAHAHEAVQ